MLRAFNFSIATHSNEESSNSVGVRKAWGETLELLLSKENVTNGFMLFNRVGTKPWPVFNRMDSTFQSLSSSVPRDHWKWGEILRRDAKVHPKAGTGPDPPSSTILWAWHRAWSLATICQHWTKPDSRYFYVIASMTPASLLCRKALTHQKPPVLNFASAMCRLPGFCTSSVTWRYFKWLEIVTSLVTIATKPMTVIGQLFVEDESTAIRCCMAVTVWQL